MAYMKCTVENRKEIGSVVVNCSAVEEEYGGADNVKVYRRDGNGDWNVIKMYEISDAESLNIRYIDVNVISGVTYEYHIDLCAGASVLELYSFVVACEFRGIVISDETSLWKTEFGTSDSQQKVEVKKNLDVQYVKTLRGRFPIRVSNSAQNYYTGTVTGLFLPSDDCFAPTIDGANNHKEAFLEFLCDSKAKLLRTGGGKAFLISIDGTPQENWSSFEGLSTITFSWTQIGDAKITRLDYNGSGLINTYI